MVASPCRVRLPALLELAAFSSPLRPAFWPFRGTKRSARQWRLPTSGMQARRPPLNWPTSRRPNSTSYINRQHDGIIFESVHQPQQRPQRHVNPSVTSRATNQSAGLGISGVFQPALSASSSRPIPLYNVRIHGALSELGNLQRRSPESLLVEPPRRRSFSWQALGGTGLAEFRHFATGGVI